MRTVIWTREARELLYQQLVARFGAYWTWEKVASPGADQDEEFDRFCGDFAETIGANSSKAVKQQIYFALPVKGRARWGQGHACNAVLNLAAALHAGFIDSTDVPSLEATPSARAHPALKRAA